MPLFFGSSRNSGKSGFYLHEEIVVISEAVSHSFNHFDSVVHALKHTGVKWEGCARSNPFGIRRQFVGEVNQGL